MPMQLPSRLKALVLFPCLLLLANVSAQNLVPNPSFEDYTLCPTNISQINRAMGWTAFTGSPDYFNACNTNDSADVPGNAVGYQYAAGGQAYMGVVTYYEPVVYRECIQAQLTSSMVAGQTVYLSMKVSPGGFGNEPFDTPSLASSGIGMRFSVAELTPMLLLPNSAPLHLNQILQDTTAWVTLSGQYVPDSAYRYIQIGNFFSDPFTDTTALDPAGLFLGGAYAFVDEVCVSYNPLDCATGMGVHDRSQTSIVTASYDPTRGILLFGLPPMEAIDLDLFSLSGQRTFSTRLASAGAMTAVPSPPLATGIYVLRLRNEHMERAVRLVVQAP